MNVARQLGEDRLLATALIQLSWALSGDARVATAAAEEGLRLFRAAGDRWGTGTGLNYLGEILRGSGDLPRAAEAYEESVAINREIGNTWVLATSTHNLACTLRRLGRDERVPALVRESLAAVRQIRSPILDAMTLIDMADVALQEGAPTRAARLLGGAARIFEDSGFVMEPTEQLELDRITGLAREMSSTDEYAAAWAEGKSMRREEAIGLTFETGPGGRLAFVTPRGTQ